MVQSRSALGIESVGGVLEIRILEIIPAPFRLKHKLYILDRIMTRVGKSWDLLCCCRGRMPINAANVQGLQ